MARCRFRRADNPNDITVTHEFGSVEAAQAFAKSDELKKAMQGAGVVGSQQSGARTKCKNKGQAVGEGISRPVHPTAPTGRLPQSATFPRARWIRATASLLSSSGCARHSMTAAFDAVLKSRHGRYSIKGANYARGAPCLSLRAVPIFACCDCATSPVTTTLEG